MATPLEYGGSGQANQAYGTYLGGGNGLGPSLNLGQQYFQQPQAATPPPAMRASALSGPGSQLADGYQIVGGQLVQTGTPSMNSQNSGALNSAVSPQAALQQQQRISDQNSAYYDSTGIGRMLNATGQANGNSYGPTAYPKPPEPNGADYAGFHSGLQPGQSMAVPTPTYTPPAQPSPQNPFSGAGTPPAYQSPAANPPVNVQHAASPPVNVSYAQLPVWNPGSGTAAPTTPYRSTIGVGDARSPLPTPAGLGGLQVSGTPINAATGMGGINTRGNGLFAGTYNDAGIQSRRNEPGGMNAGSPVGGGVAVGGPYTNGFVNNPSRSYSMGTGGAPLGASGMGGIQTGQLNHGGVTQMPIGQTQNPYGVAGPRPAAPPAYNPHDTPFNYQGSAGGYGSFGGTPAPRAPAGPASLTSFGGLQAAYRR